MHAFDLLRVDSDDIVAEWANVARREVPPDAEAPGLALIDGLPELVGQLADWLDHSSGQCTVDWSSARRHAVGRLHRDFAIVHLLHEYRILRDVVLRRLLAARSDLEDADLARASGALDLALAEGVDSFCSVRERVLRSENERLRLALSSAAIGMWEWLPKDHVLTWDARTRALCGLGADAAPSYEHFLSMVHPKDRERVDALVQEKLRSGSTGDDYRVEYRVIGADGVERWLAAMGRVLDRDEQGSCLRFIGTVLDISESKRAQELAAQTALLRERFLGIVSHDLRNPLAAIRLVAGAMQRADGLTDAERRNVGHVLSNVDRMSRMIGDLLDLTRSRLGGGIPVEKKRTSMKDIADGVMKNLELARPGRRVVAEAEGDPEGEWDSDRIAQALGNLVTNALDHGDPGSPVHVRIHGHEDWVTVVVHNEGEPIPPERLPHIFDPFVRAQGAPSRGLGLGLFIVNEIARAHGGLVSVSSDQPSGTTFQLTLPRRVA